MDSSGASGGKRGIVAYVRYEQFLRQDQIMNLVEEGGELLIGT